MDEKNKECKEYHVLALEKGLTILNSVYTRSGQNSTPNSNATNLHSSQKRCCSFCISSSNASPTFQVQKSIFHQMTKPIQVTVILPLLLAISFSRNDDIHSSISGISNDLIGVIPTIGQQCFRRYSINQVNSFFAISSGTLCDKYSDRHTICIHGKVNLGIEPPFVRLMS